MTLAVFVILVSVFPMVLPAAGQQETAASLTIRFANGVSRFRVGEVIPVELAFGASVGNTYEMSTSMYDRSGRLLDNDQITELESLTLGPQRENIARLVWPRSARFERADTHRAADLTYNCGLQ